MESPKPTSLKKLGTVKAYDENFPSLIDDGTTNEKPSFFSQENVHVLPNQCDDRPPSNRDSLLNLLA